MKSNGTYNETLDYRKKHVDDLLFLLNLGDIDQFRNVIREGVIFGSLGSDEMSGLRKEVYLYVKEEEDEEFRASIGNCVYEDYKEGMDDVSRKILNLYREISKKDVDVVTIEECKELMQEGTLEQAFKFKTLVDYRETCWETYLKKIENLIQNDDQTIQLYLDRMEKSFMIGVYSLKAYVKLKGNIELVIYNPSKKTKVTPVLMEQIPKSKSDPNGIELHVQLLDHDPYFCFTDVKSPLLSNHLWGDEETCFRTLKDQSPSFMHKAIKDDNLSIFKLLLLDPTKKRIDVAERELFFHQLWKLKLNCENSFLIERFNGIDEIVQQFRQNLNTYVDENRSRIDRNSIIHHAQIKADEKADACITDALTKFLKKEKKTILGIPDLQSFDPMNFCVDNLNVNNLKGSSFKGILLKKQKPQDTQVYSPITSDLSSVNLHQHISHLRFSLRLDSQFETYQTYHENVFNTLGELLRDPDTFFRESEIFMATLSKKMKSNRGMIKKHLDIAERIEESISKLRAEVSHEVKEAFESLGKLDVKFKQLPDGCERFLYENGYVDTNFKYPSTGNTLLHEAFVHGAKSIIHYLIKKQANIFELNNANECPLEIGIHSKKSEIRLLALELFMKVSWKSTSVPSLREFQQDINVRLVQELQVFAEHLHSMETKGSFLKRNSKKKVKIRKIFASYVNSIAKFLDAARPLQLRIDLDEIEKEKKNSPRSIRKLLDSSYSDTWLSLARIEEYEKQLEIYSNRLKEKRFESTLENCCFRTSLLQKVVHNTESR